MTETMVFPHLPPDLVEEILSRVPAKSLKRLRSTCKQWNALFSDRRFTEKHFRTAAKQSMVLMLKDYKLFSMSVDLNVIAPSIEFMGALDLKDHSDQVDIAEVSHCDGLLLCTTKDDRLVVWNPCLGETKWIPLGSGGNYNKYTFALGYETNKSCHSYKILRFWYVLEPVRCVMFEIYEFSSNSWRGFNDVAIDDYVIMLKASVSLKGNAYWFADDIGAFVLCFDFTTERFKRVCVPQLQCGYYMALTVVREEKLAMLHRSVRTEAMDMWVANKTDTEWSKSFSMNIQNLNYFPEFTSLLMDEENKVAMCCNSSGLLETWNMIYIFREDVECCEEIPYVAINKPWWLEEPFLDSRNRLWWPCIFNYVPSLVQIP